MRERPDDVLSSISEVRVPIHLNRRGPGKFLGDDQTMEVSLTLLGGEPFIDLDIIADNPLVHWSEMSESIGSESLRELADFIDWLNDQEYFLKACTMLFKALEGHVVHAGVRDE